MPGWLRRFEKRVVRRIKTAVIRHHQRCGKVLFSDTTMRDGEQMPGATLDPDDKLAIAMQLEKLGVHSLDAGFPASSPADCEAIRKMIGVVKKPVITGLCRTVAADVDVAAETLAGLPPHKRGVGMFCGISPQHRTHKLGKSKSEVLSIIEKGIGYASEKFHIVAFGGEDGSRCELDFMVESFRTAINAGATTVAYTDTVGILTPTKVQETILELKSRLPELEKALLAVHFHNDLGLAVANTLAAIEVGANVVQGTINGIGERAGNASLEEIALAMALNPDQYGMPETIEMKYLLETCQLVAKLTGVAVPLMKPIAGDNIFKTEAGIHQDGILKNPETYLPFEPSLVGATGVTFVIGRHSGRKAVAHQLQVMGQLPSESEVVAVLDAIKALPKEIKLDDAMLVDLYQSVCQRRKSA